MCTRCRADPRRRLVPTSAPGAHLVYCNTKLGASAQPAPPAPVVHVDVTLRDLQEKYGLVSLLTVETPKGSATHTSINLHAVDLLLNRVTLRFVPPEPDLLENIRASRAVYSPGSELCAAGSTFILPITVYTPVFYVIMTTAAAREPRSKPPPPPPADASVSAITDAIASTSIADPPRTATDTDAAAPAKPVRIPSQPATINAFELLGFYTRIIQMLLIVIGNSHLESDELAAEMTKLQLADAEEDADADAHKNEQQEKKAEADPATTARAAMLLKMENDFVDELENMHQVIASLQSRYMAVIVGCKDDSVRITKFLQLYTVSVLNAYESLLLHACNFPSHVQMVFATPTALPEEPLCPLEKPAEWYVSALCKQVADNRACIRDRDDAIAAHEKAVAAADTAAAEELGKLVEASKDITFCRTFDSRVVPDELLSEIKDLSGYVGRVLLPSMHHKVQLVEQKTKKQ
jgi:hypothetical protein